MQKITETHYQLAQQIESFLYNFNTYEYHDQYDDRKEVVEEIVNQLSNLTIFQKVYEVYHDKDLTDEEIFDKLGGILKI